MTPEVVQIPSSIASMSDDTLNKIYQLDELVSSCPQVPVTTEHLLHAGMYVRTLRIPAETVLIGTLIKIPTVLVLVGDCILATEHGPKRYSGVNVLAGAENRKGAAVALTDLVSVMSFATSAKTVPEAEQEFAAEYQRLFSHYGNNIYQITGEQCQAEFQQQQSQQSSVPQLPWAP